MRYDDEKRPKSIGADASALQVSGSPLPCVTLIRPMESGVIVARCEDSGVPAYHYPCNNGYPCERCEHVSEATWGWLACIHAHIEGSRFGYHTAWVSSIDALLSAWIADPEAALLRYFKYSGPEPKRVVRSLSPAVGDLFEENK